MTILQLICLVLGPMFAVEVPIADAPLPSAEGSVNDGLKGRFKDRFKNNVTSAQEKDESVAVASEWLQLRDSVGERQFGRGSDYFLGFISGRCRVAPPKWWGGELEKGSVTRDGRAWFPCHRINRRWHGDEATWQFSGFDAVAVSGDKLTLKSGTRQLILVKTEEFADVGTVRNIWSPVDETAIAGAMDQEVCAVVFDCPTYFGGPPEIHCMNSDTGKVLWKRPVFIGNLPGGGIGGGEIEGSFTEVVIAGDRIVVWVGHQVSMCFEVFRKADGKRTAVFATEYLDGLRMKGADN